MEVFRPQNVYADLNSETLDNVLTQEYGTFWGRTTFTGQWQGASCGSFPSPKCYADLNSETLDNVLTQEYETFWGRTTFTGCPQPKD